MKLILDTSSAEMRVILQPKEGVVLSERATKKHMENLLPSIEKLLLKSRSSLGDVAFIGVVIGPGSFTGIRIAVTTAKAFCQADSTKKIVPLNMLDLLGFVAAKKTKKSFFVLIKCTANKIYSAQFDEKGTKIFEGVKMKEEVEKITDFQKFFFSDKDFFDSQNAKELKLKEQDYIEFLNLNLSKKNFSDFKTLSPLYLALSQAEEELLKKENKKNEE